MTGLGRRIAGAPITWGVCEVPGWGHQLAPDRVLSEMARIGLGATELGPDGYLPADPSRLSALLNSHGLRLVGGFVPVVLHSPEQFEIDLKSAEAAARLLAAVGAEVLVLAAATERADYKLRGELTSAEWRILVRSIDEVIDMASGFSLTVALHPHYGTMIEGRGHVNHVLDVSSVPLCLDTGHLALGGADPLDIARRAGERIAHVHLKDVATRIAAEVRGGGLDYHSAVGRGLYRPLGRGDVPIAEIVRTLESGAYRGWYVLEQDVVLDSEPDGDASGPVEDAAESLAFLQRVAGLHRGEIPE